MAEAIADRPNYYDEDKYKHRHEEDKKYHHEEHHNAPSVLRQLDWIPLISTITGLVRAIIGIVEIVIGIFSWPFELIYDSIQGTTHQLLIVQGCANVFRGSVAAVPLAGNFALYLYDNSNVVQH